MSQNQSEIFLFFPRFAFLLRFFPRHSTLCVGCFKETWRFVESVIHQYINIDLCRAQCSSRLFTANDWKGQKDLELRTNEVFAVVRIVCFYLIKTRVICFVISLLISSQRVRLIFSVLTFIESTNFLIFTPKSVLRPTITFPFAKKYTFPLTF